MVFKGGFVLRHALGHLRFSKDVHATRHDPPQQRLDAAAVAAVIQRASIPNIVQFAPGAAATDSRNSLDFDSVHVSSDVFIDTKVQVEISYREAVVGTPVLRDIGAPYFRPFEILTMTPAEMASEKIRTLAQRRRATDLADLAVLLLDLPASADATIGRYAVAKFAGHVKQGKANRVERIMENIDELAMSYDDDVPLLFPAAPDFTTAKRLVLSRILPLIP